MKKKTTTKKKIKESEVKEPKVEEPKKEEKIDSSNLTDEQMNKLLAEIYFTPYWPAMMKYIDSQQRLIDISLRAVDVFKEPTLAARNQGMAQALDILPTYILQEMEVRKNEPSE